MEQYGNSIYDEVLDEQDLLEETLVQFSLWMKEGTTIVDRLSTLNTLIVQLTSMELKFEDEDKANTLLCSLPKSWDNIVTSISFNSTYVLDYDSVVGALLAEEMRRKSSQETSTSEAMLVKGRTKEKNQRSYYQSKSRRRKGRRKMLVLWENMTSQERLLEKKGIRGKLYEGRKLGCNKFRYD
jgi:hypothetical protein